MALTTLQKVRRYLNHPPARDDALLRDLINDADDTIKQALNFNPEAVNGRVEFHDSIGGQEKLYPHHIPIRNINSFKFDLESDFGSGTEIDSDNYRLIEVDGDDVAISLKKSYRKSPRAFRLEYDSGYENMASTLDLAARKFVAFHYNRSKGGADAVRSDTIVNSTTSWKATGENGLPQAVNNLITNFQDARRV